MRLWAYFLEVKLIHILFYMNQFTSCMLIAHCLYSDSPSYCAKYGKLENYQALELSGFGKSYF